MLFDAPAPNIEQVHAIDVIESRPERVRPDGYAGAREDVSQRGKGESILARWRCGRRQRGAVGSQHGEGGRKERLPDLDRIDLLDGNGQSAERRAGPDDAAERQGPASTGLLRERVESGRPEEKTSSPVAQSGAFGWILEWIG